MISYAYEAQTVLQGWTTTGTTTTTTTNQQTKQLTPTNDKKNI
jgi:hypothetical protein